MSTDINTLNRVLANWMQQHIKSIIYCGQVEFSLGMQGWFNTQNQLIILTEWLGEKACNHFNGCKNIWQNWIAFQY